MDSKANVNKAQVLQENMFGDKCFSLSHSAVVVTIFSQLRLTNFHILDFSGSSNWKEMAINSNPQNPNSSQLSVYVWKFKYEQSAGRESLNWRVVVYLESPK